MNFSKDDDYRSLEETLSRGQTLTYEDVAPILEKSSGKVSFKDLIASSSGGITPGKNDILCGRDKTAFNHIGNKRFRVLIAKNYKRYQAAGTRDIKTLITNEIIEQIRKEECRFLRRNPDTKLWHPADKQYIHEKVSHALRSAKERKPRSGGSSSGKKGAKNPKKKYTAQEDNTFNFLMNEQQKIFRELLHEEFQGPIDFAVIDEIGAETQELAV